jgi:hypothetical protein
MGVETGRKGVETGWKGGGRENRKL